MRLMKSQGAQYMSQLGDRFRKGNMPYNFKVAKTRSMVGIGPDPGGMFRQFKDKVNAFRVNRRGQPPVVFTDAADDTGSFTVASAAPGERERRGGEVELGALPDKRKRRGKRKNRTQRKRARRRRAEEQEARQRALNRSNPSGVSFTIDTDDDLSDRDDPTAGKRRRHRRRRRGKRSRAK